MEELRGQLGERLTPAMAIAAKSMGVTTAELERMVESGISAEAFLPKFGAAMEEAFAGAESAQASVNRLKNQFDELLLKFGEEGGINAAYQKLLDDVGAGLAWIEEKIGSLDGALTGGLSDGLTSAYELIKEVGAEDDRQRPRLPEHDARTNPGDGRRDENPHPLGQHRHGGNQRRL